MDDVRDRTVTVDEVRAKYPSDPGLLEQVLRPYRDNCKYLKAATITVEGDSLESGRITATCEFEIPESCYIDDTGHFNSVEFNICFNQMFYYVAAKAVQEGFMYPFSRWSTEDYWKRQLADFLITDFRSSFRSAMSGRSFRGEIEVVDIAEWEGSDIRDPLIVMRTQCRYWDEFGGESRGDISIAITNPPPATH
ncbi:FcoT family thioesterase [Streptomyces sp. NPDC048484]|uniref:FcoT family thioesterase n=1 Tax=Streptomyces sp. NPDC048484 TaxID=3155146 RepID=UPI003415BCFB